jgi:undecaprenyl-diphosphatase
MNTLIILAAKYLVILPPILLAFVFWKASSADRKILILRGLVVLVLSVALAKGGGALFNDVRPFVAHHTTPLIPHAPDTGFPSDHTLLAAACALLTLPFSKRLGIAGLVFALVVGLARIACGLHTLLDIGGSLVFAGFANGAASLTVKPSRTKAH